MREIEERYLESIMLSVLIIFNESELQEIQDIKLLIQLAIGSWILLDENDINQL